MGEEVVNIVQKFMSFYDAQWSILGNLFLASSSLHTLQSRSQTLNLELVKAHADIDETISRTISIFNIIVSHIGEYKDLSADAFAFLSDDLKRAVKFSEQIAQIINEGYTDAAKDKVIILRTKLEEISEKVSEHLKQELEGS